MVYILPPEFYCQWGCRKLATTSRSLLAHTTHSCHVNESEVGNVGSDACGMSQPRDSDL